MSGKMGTIKMIALFFRLSAKQISYITTILYIRANHFICFVLKNDLKYLLQMFMLLVNFSTFSVALYLLCAQLKGIYSDVEIE